ncbi:substrate-binding domain-containing protein [Streptomyces sp. NBC_01306]|uniref:substrate-binding domain-containing protein n=1 Tax=Streptomyces sp. NBC_01306 TaxID=2903819 RepID=UPI002257AF3C|nr:substrate-binding domain-containing protein [Streptomyces sp. NBC_01306]MCX4728637.1 substrate-binding domain-containing protein [Streptomyces sp. NBC_01306]
MAVGVIRAFHEAGLTVPGDTAVASIDGSEEGRYATPTLTTVVPDKAAIASLAVTSLANRIGAQTTPRPTVHLAPHRLEVGESTTGVRRPVAD